VIIAAVINILLAEWKPFDGDLLFAATLRSGWINAFCREPLVRFSRNTEPMATYLIAGTFSKKNKSISD